MEVSVSRVGRLRVAIYHEDTLQPEARGRRRGEAGVVGLGAAAGDHMGGPFHAVGRQFELEFPRLVSA